MSVLRAGRRGADPAGGHMAWPCCCSMMLGRPGQHPVLPAPGALSPQLGKHTEHSSTGCARGLRSTRGGMPGEIWKASEKR